MDRVKSLRGRGSLNRVMEEGWGLSPGGRRETEETESGGSAEVEAHWPEGNHLSCEDKT